MFLNSKGSEKAADPDIAAFLRTWTEKQRKDILQKDWIRKSIL